MAAPHPTRRNPLFVLRFWLSGLLFAVPASLLVTLLPGQDRRRRAARYTARTLLRLAGVGLRVKGLDRLPEGSCIVAGNHASYLDGIVLTAALPPRFGFVIKREVTKAPLVGWLLHRLGSEFVERFDKKAAHNDANRIIRRARTGGCLGVFPEGTFRREPGLRPFHLGAFLTATRAGLPVVPLVIRGARAILPADTWWPAAGTVEVELLQPVRPHGRTGDAARVLREKVRERILAHCGEPDAAHHG